MFNPAKASAQIKEDFIRYLCTSYRTKDENYNQQFKALLEQEITKGPFVDINDVFETGHSINDLINEGVASSLYRELEAKKPVEAEIDAPLNRPLFKHQEQAIRSTSAGKNIVVTTGTGSGKTECFLYSIMNSLLKEKEKGTLSEGGVRAILIYPMNALANDQVDRLRSMLMFYPDISFGVFTGETESNPLSAENRYNRTHSSETVARARTKLPNERLSREEMYANPPHILITNYVMLEYLLFRPDYSDVFKGSNVHFIVLDESHVYRGATGMETAMLLRKLKARLNKNEGQIQFILTSATLGKPGESEDDIASFASSLTGETFGPGDIIYGQRKQTDITTIPQKQYPVELFRSIADSSPETILSVFAKFGVACANEKKPEETIYQICHDSQYYYLLRNHYSGPVAIVEVATWLGLDLNDTIAFLFSCSKAGRNGMPLLDIHYHFFIRAMEGAYVTLSGKRELFLDRKEEVINSDGTKDKVFEIARCSNCGDIALVGNIVSDDSKGELNFVMQNPPLDKGRIEERDPQFFHIVDQRCSEDETEIYDDDGEKETKKEDYWLCPHCGRVTKTISGKPKCGHDSDEMILLRVKKGSDKCLFCSEGNYSAFYVGSDGATSIIGMSLFEALPTKKVSITDGDTRKTFEGGKQFLCFSDSRSEAAFFACYEDKTYNTFIARRGLAKVLDGMRQEIIDSKVGYCTATDLANSLGTFFANNQSFAESLANEGVNKALHDLSMNYSWMIVLDQLVGANRKNYLQNMGFLQFKYLGINHSVVADIKKHFGLHIDDERLGDLLNLLAMTFAKNGALIPEKSDLEPFVMEYVYHSSVQNALLEQKTEGSGSHNQSWLPQNLKGKTDKWRRSYRQNIVMKTLGYDGAQANDFLRYFWESCLTNPQTNSAYSARPIGSYGGFAMPTSSFGIRVPGCADAHWYRCKRCGHIFAYDLNGACPLENCGGSLEEIKDVAGYYKDNYYYRVYQGNYLRKLLIKEHTAQLGREKGAEYQNLFRDNLINALSCSTTFEMGVNLGHLETVFLRDVPPTASNYVQRAGRAGRSQEASAYAITYAKLSSHDFNYFENPLEMICGRINPPLLKRDNEKIVYRHIYSVVLGYFFKKRPEFFGKDEVSVFVNPASVNDGYSEFKKMVLSRPDELTALLKASFGGKIDQEFFISAYGDGAKNSWVRDLIGDGGRLESAVAVYKNTCNEFDKEKDELIKTEQYELIEGVKKRKEFFLNQPLISFLVNANVLPKYGFPVDTVELSDRVYSPKNRSRFDQGISLSRDMSQAISEYAPGCKVVADGHMYTPRYISQVIRFGQAKFDDGYYCECGTCHTPNFMVDDSVTAKCSGCGATLSGVNKIKAIQPSAGMLTDGKVEDVPMTKPQKYYHSREYYVGTNYGASKKVFVVGSKKITIISTENDKIMVTTPTNEPFYVCQKCGFALGKMDSVQKEDPKNLGNLVFDGKETRRLQSGVATGITCAHITPSGKRCEQSVLERRILVHTFNTDIIQILFNGATFDENAQAMPGTSPTGISVLYALLYAICRTLDIEDNDISGCLIHNESGENTNFRLVIYDNVPGGAGQVKRILDNDGKNLRAVLESAYDKMQCECDTSCYKCLRTYENQYYHSILSHKKASDFLKDYQGVVTPTQPDSDTTLKLKFSPSKLHFDPNSGSLKALMALLGGQLSKKAAEYFKEKCDINPDEIVVPVINWSTNVLMKWNKEKILLLRTADSAIFAKYVGKCDWTLILGDDTFDPTAFDSLLKKGE
jgi:hypothetical protein